VSRAVLWLSAALLAWTHLGYGLALALLAKVRGAGPREQSPAPAEPPLVSLVVAAYREEAVIAQKVANALALDWPRDRLEVIVAVDGGADPAADGTAGLAREAGADVVLELPRGGKVRAQDAGVERARGEVLAFSDANARWEPDALGALVAPFEADARVGFACGRVTFVDDAGTNQEGVYWRYEMWIRGHESALASVTAGNGAIYAVRRAAYARVDPRVSHDLSLPARLVREGWRAVDVAGARASEKMVPTVEGEWQRKRRMMAHAWPMVATGGLLDPRGYPPAYAVMVLSHRALRYASPFLHLAAFAAALVRPRRHRVALAAQLALLLAAAAGGRSRRRPLLLARYYVLTTASIAAGLHDWLRHGTPVGWEAAEGTR
jgi:hypothetical protein